MRKVRDYDAELKTLEQRARSLRQRKVQQLGELVIASGADQLVPEVLAGALIAAVTADAAAKEAWQIKGRSFFRRARDAGHGRADDQGSAAPVDGRAQPPAGEGRA